MKCAGIFGIGLLLLAASTVCAAAPTATSGTVGSAKNQARHLSQPQSSAKGQTATRSVRRPAAKQTAATNRKPTTATRKQAQPAANAAMARVSRATTAAATRVKKAVVVRRRWHERFTASSFAKGDIGQDDITAGEDPVVRQAAIDALGEMNGTAVVIDPSNGRILAMVNQKLALSPGAEPCSTIKLSVALAALQEGLVTRETPVKLSGFKMNMTQALAKSNNLYFEELGRQLGFERVRHYANQFGLGELAGYRIEGEQLGQYPDHELPEAEGGVGRMCSFGQGVSMTPLQLGALVAAIANRGTLYYLQHPTTPDEVANFAPRVKRTLEIANYVPDLEDGMAGAVEYGTARSLRTNFHELPVFGKTGTCSDNGTRFGWFASFSDSPQGSLVTVFFLEGGRPTFGPRAAELTGQFYRNLWDSNYFQDRGQRAAKSPEPGSMEASSGAGAGTAQ
jgi:membrane carboxypeptidase/penicillin-binding protein